MLISLDLISALHERIYRVVQMSFASFAAGVTYAECHKVFWLLRWLTTEYMDSLKVGQNAAALRFLAFSSSKTSWLMPCWHNGIFFTLTRFPFSRYWSILFTISLYKSCLIWTSPIACLIALKIRIGSKTQSWSVKSWRTDENKYASGIENSSRT